MEQIRPITPADDAAIAAIIRANLEHYHLNIPGTAYFDPEVDHLSRYYAQQPDQRAYFILTDDDGQVLGGAGLARFGGFAHCAELQKLYLTDRAKGKGLGQKLLRAVEHRAGELGYQSLYLETHSALTAALRLYEKSGYERIPRPDCVLHSTMDLFYRKML